MRQWVLSLPKRLRPALRNHSALATRVLRIFIGSIERELKPQRYRAGSRAAGRGELPAAFRLGA